MINSTCVWVDNTAAIAVATGHDFTHETVKHVTVKVRFIQECVQRQMILIAYIKTRKNIADIMTKQSAGPQFAQHRDYALGIIVAGAGSKRHEMGSRSCIIASHCKSCCLELSRLDYTGAIMSAIVLWQILNAWDETVLDF